MMEIGMIDSADSYNSQTVFYINGNEVERYRAAGFEVKPLHRIRGDDIHCYIAIEPTSCQTTSNSVPPASP
jgi:hypothetical protein